MVLYICYYTIIGGRTIAFVSAAYTCNGPCSPADSENMQMSDIRRQLLTDIIAEEQSVSTTFEGGSVRITYFRRGQQGVITTVCSAGLAAAVEGNICSEFPLNFLINCRYFGMPIGLVIIYVKNLCAM